MLYWTRLYTIIEMAGNSHGSYIMMRGGSDPLRYKYLASLRELPVLRKFHASTNLELSIRDVLASCTAELMAENFVPQSAAFAIQPSLSSPPDELRSLLLLRLPLSRRGCQNTFGKHTQFEPRSQIIFRFDHCHGTREALPPKDPDILAEHT